MPVLQDEDILIFKHKDENTGHGYSVRFVSLEGNELHWAKEQAQKIKDTLVGSAY